MSSEISPEPFYVKLRRANTYAALKSYKLHERESLVQSNWASRLVCEKRSAFRELFQLLKFINLFYIAIIPPFTIAFSSEISRPLVAVESISLLISLFCVIIKLRTPELFKRERTVELSKVLKVY